MHAWTEKYWGALIGAQVSDHVFLLMTDAAVELMFSNNGNMQLGVDIGVVRITLLLYCYIVFCIVLLLCIVYSCIVY